MATHRKARTSLLSAPVPRAAVGITTAALATVTLLSESASASPAPRRPAQPSIAEVQARVDALLHQAEVATDKYDGAKAQTARQSATVNRLLTLAARRTQSLNDARRALGQYAAAQYRTGGDDTTGRYLLSPDPQSLVDQTHLTDVLSHRQQQAVETFRTEQAAATQQRIQAAQSLATLTTEQARLKASKAEVQQKLSEAQHLLNSLTAQEKARLAALRAKQEAAARAKAAQLAAQIAAKQRAAQAAAAAAAAKTTSTTTSTPSATPAPSTTSTAAAKAIAFARAQLGKPYEWGANGPDTYDCSSLIQQAYKAAGINLPRTTYDQVNAGTRVAESDLRPGDLIFFYSDISHVGLYIGGGMMIHAPHTGTVVKIAPITEMPFYAAVRP